MLTRAKQQISILKIRQSGLSDRSQRHQNYLGQCVLLEGRAERHFQEYKILENKKKKMITQRAQKGFLIDNKYFSSVHIIVLSYDQSIQETAAFWSR